MYTGSDLVGQAMSGNPKKKKAQKQQWPKKRLISVVYFLFAGK